MRARIAVGKPLRAAITKGLIMATKQLPTTSYRAATGTRRAAYPAFGTLEKNGDSVAPSTRDALDWTAWLCASHAKDGLSAGNLKPAIAQRAVTWFAANGVSAPKVGGKPTVAYVKSVLDACEAAGVPADELAAMRAHYGA